MTNPTLEDRIRKGYKALALVSLALQANLDRMSDTPDPDLLLMATEAAHDLVCEAFADLYALDLPSPLGKWTDETKDPDLLAALERYAHLGEDLPAPRRGVR